MLKPKKKTIPIEQSVININQILAGFRELISIINDDNINNRLKRLSEMIEYSNPSTDEYISHLDSRISAQLGDLKILLISKQPRKNIEFKLVNLMELITERNAKA